jgi:hypothetical protein
MQRKKTRLLYEIQFFVNGSCFLQKKQYSFDADNKDIHIKNINEAHEKSGANIHRSKILCQITGDR